MKTVISLFLIVLIVRTLFGTAQVADILIFNGDTLSLYSNPLESFYNEENPRPVSFFVYGDSALDSTYEEHLSSACWRGYIATWEIIDDHLFLIRIEECIGDKVSDLGKLFPNKLSLQNKVLADWFSGLLVLPYGEIIKYVHMGYASLFENYTILEIKAGKLTQEKSFAGEEYIKFKRRQFEQYKKTDSYKSQLQKLTEGGEDPKFIEGFLSEYIIEYTSEFLTD